MLSASELRQLYGKEYVESFEKTQSKFRLKRLIDSITLRNDYKVADFACGNGKLLPIICNRIGEYVGVDFSKDFIDAAENTRKSLSISNARFICDDIIEFCLENQKVFDVAFAIDFSEHVYDPEWSRILKAIKISLKFSGKIYIHTPNAEFFMEILKANNFIFKQFPEHVAIRSLKENRDLLEENGFIINKVKLIPHYNIQRILHPLSFLPFVGKYFKARIFIEASA